MQSNSGMNSLSFFQPLESHYMTSPLNLFVDLAPNCTLPPAQVAFGFSCGCLELGASVLGIAFLQLFIDIGLLLPSLLLPSGALRILWL